MHEPATLSPIQAILRVMPAATNAEYMQHAPMNHCGKALSQLSRRCLVAIFRGIWWGSCIVEFDASCTDKNELIAEIALY